MARKNISLISALCFLLGSLVISTSSALAADKKSGYLMSEPSGCKVWVRKLKPVHSVHWNGGCRNGLAEGEGSARSAWVTDAGESGHAYYDVITMRAGKKTGYGEMRYDDGATYKGEYKNGAREGQGVYRFSDGRHYSGQWKNHVQDGQGTFTWPSGKQYSGQWKAGKYNGQGTMFYSSGRKYVGTWKAGKRHGEVLYFSKKGVPSVGVYLKDKREGYHIEIADSGSTYWEKYINGDGVGSYDKYGSVEAFYRAIATLETRKPFIKRDYATLKRLATKLANTDYVASQLKNSSVKSTWKPALDKQVEAHNAVKYFRFPNFQCTDPWIPQPGASSSVINQANKKNDTWRDCINRQYDKDEQALVNLVRKKLNGKYKLVAGNRISYNSGICKCNDQIGELFELRNKRTNSRNKVRDNFFAAVDKHNLRIKYSTSEQRSSNDIYERLNDLQQQLEQMRRQQNQTPTWTPNYSKDDGFISGQK